MAPQRTQSDTAVFSWLSANFRILMVCLGLLVGGVVAWSNVNYRVTDNCAHIEQHAAGRAEEMAALTKTLDAQDTKLDGITESVTRLLVIREREDRGH